MNKLNVILILIIGINTISCGQSESHNSKNNDKEITDWKLLSEEKYEIRYPFDWDIDKSGQMGTSFFLFSQLSDENDNFKENINLLIQDLSNYNLTLDQFVKISEEQINTMITDANIIFNKMIKGDKGEYQKLIYSGKQGIFDLTFEQYYWVVEEKAYVLTFTSESSKFKKSQLIGEKILNSFVLK